MSHALSDSPLSDTFHVARLAEVLRRMSQRSQRSASTSLKQERRNRRSGGAMAWQARSTESPELQRLIAQMQSLRTWMRGLTLDDATHAPVLVATPPVDLRRRDASRAA